MPARSGQRRSTGRSPRRCCGVVKIRGGFDPGRMDETVRPDGVVPQIVDAPTQIASEAKGFTEVKIVGVGGGGNTAVNRIVEADVHGLGTIALQTHARGQGPYW